MSNFAKPENALKRAEELVNVGQKQAALQALHDIITSKRHRAWQKTLEKIMIKYIDLCVEMRKGRFAKDGLIQYRIICQQVNVSSLEEVIKHFLKASTEKTEQAQAAAEKVTLDVEDLEADRSPEDLMLSFVSGEKGKERTDRELVTPWFKFLWETYRTVLEILRNNSKLEALYAMTAHRAFQFCLQYKRTNEFRRLCEILRNHLTNLNKYRDQRDRPDLSLPESFQLYLDTRFEQLKVATELELWQEAFRSVEDVHGLVALVKKSPKPSQMAVYYAKLTNIFWMSDSLLFHAFSWLKLYSLQRSHNKNLKEKDVQMMASCVVLSALAVLPYEKRGGGSQVFGFLGGGGSAEAEMERERMSRMAALLGLNMDQKKDPKDVLSRSALFSEMVAKGIVAYALPQVKELYHLLELDFHPLDLGAKVKPLLAKLSEISDVKLSSAAPLPKVDLQAYVGALEKVATLRIIHQASQVYDTIKIPNLIRLATFGDVVFVEGLLVAAVKNSFVNAKVDHSTGTISFGRSDLESDDVRDHLSLLMKGLTKAAMIIKPPAEKSARERTVLGDLNVAIEKEHQRLLARKVLIEQRKERAEREVIEKEREDQKEKIQLQRQHEEAEARRLAVESKRREEDRIRREIEQRELEEARALLLEAEKRKGKKGKKNIEETMKLDKRQLMEEALSEQLKEKAEQERKLQKMAKMLDHLERAKREEERPYLEEAYARKVEEDRVYFENQQEAARKASEVQHAKDLEEKTRLLKMLEEKAMFEEQVVGRRRGEFERLKREREEKLAELREMRRVERISLRKREFYKRQEEEKVYRAMVEEENRKREELERKKREEQERLKKLEEIAAKQRQRELEAEEKARKEKEEILGRAARERVEERPGKYIPISRRSGADLSARREDVVPRSAEREREPERAGGGKYFPPGRGLGGDRRGEDGPPRRFEASRGGKYEPPSSRVREGAGEKELDREREGWGSGRREERSTPRFIGGGRTAEREREAERPRPSADSGEKGVGAQAGSGESSAGKWKPRFKRTES